MFIYYINYMNLVFYVIIGIFIFLLTKHYTNSDKKNKSFMIKTIIRGCARWAAASLQDKSPIVAVLHANYATGYLWALRDIFSDTEIKRFSDIDIIDFQKKITDVQDKATKLLIKVCPKYASNIDIYLGKIGGEYA